MLRVVAIQHNPVVGGIEGNLRQVAAGLERARALGAHVAVFPEMALCGYPAEDLWARPEFIAAVEEALGAVAPLTAGLTALVGTPVWDGGLFNGAVLFHDGQRLGCVAKRALNPQPPGEETRYFTQGQGPALFRWGGAVVGVAIGEDAAEAMSGGTGGVDVWIHLSASPYYAGHREQRERWHRVWAEAAGAPVVVAHLVGAQDGWVFDGHSFAVDPGGGVVARAEAFEEGVLAVDIPLEEARRLRSPGAPAPRFPLLASIAAAGGTPGPAGGHPGPDAPQPPAAAAPVSPVGYPAAPVAGGVVARGVFALEPGSGPSAGPAPGNLEPEGLEGEVYRALMLGTADYARKNGFQTVALGLSGGLDSALVAAIAADALGPDAVVGVSMPSRYTSAGSREDARQLAANLGIRFLEIGIDEPFQAFLSVLGPAFDAVDPEGGGRRGPEDVTEENLQPRIRGTLLMAFSNKFGWLVLTAGNKSEAGVGYSTLYGDMAGGLAVLADVPKTLAYRLARWRNRQAGRDLVPRRILEKPPSAELRPDQKDTDSLPEYGVLDPILQGYVEGNLSLAGLVRRGFPDGTARRIAGLVVRNEYKRRQGPPGIKISRRAFGKDWRMPITNRFPLR